MSSQNLHIRKVACHSIITGPLNTQTEDLLDGGIPVILEEELLVFTVELRVVVRMASGLGVGMQPVVRVWVP